MSHPVFNPMIRHQDQLISKLDQNVDKLIYLSKEIQQEANLQNKELDYLKNDIENNSVAIEKRNKTVTKMIKKEDYTMYYILLLIL